MTTIRQLITDALSLLGEVGAGEAARAEDAADALRYLNRMLDSWSASGRTVFTESSDTFTLIAGDASYTLGSGGDLNMAQPVRIVGSYITDGSVRRSVTIRDKDWIALLEAPETQGIPTDIYFDGNYPLSNVSLYPVPNKAYSLTILNEKPLSVYSSLSDTVSLPVGYERAIVYNLAIEISPIYGKTASTEIIRIASRALRAIKSANTDNDQDILRVDQTLLAISRNSYNITSDR